jgi:hypothetical protein
VSASNVRTAIAVFCVRRAVPGLAGFGSEYREVELFVELMEVAFDSHCQRLTAIIVIAR